jgi:uncharacterized Zn ribbon protein
MEININISEIHIHLSEPGDGMERKEFGHGVDWKEILKLLKMPGQSAPNVNVIAPNANKVVQEVNSTTSTGSVAENNIHPLKGMKATTTASKKCKKCKKEYKPTGNAQLYCLECRPLLSSSSASSEQNRIEKRTNGIFRICKHCGKEFEKEFRYQLYCNNECKIAGKQNWILRYKQKNKSEKAQFGSVKPCKLCNKEFTIKYKNQLYCSKECSHEAERLSKAKYRNAHKKIKEIPPSPSHHFDTMNTSAQRDGLVIVPVGLPVKNCLKCGKEFQPKFKGQKLCSEECSRKPSKAEEVIRLATVNGKGINLRTGRLVGDDIFN